MLTALTSLRSHERNTKVAVVMASDMTDKLNSIERKEDADYAEDHLDRAKSIVSQMDGPIMHVEKTVHDIALALSRLSKIEGS